MNSIEAAFIGRVGRDPDLRTSQSGNPWTALSVAVGEGEEVQWIRVAVFGERAEQLAGQLHKGDRVYVEGRLKLDTWTAQDGKERTGLSVAAWKAEKLGEIGRHKPARPKAPLEGENPAPASTRSAPDVHRRDPVLRPSINEPDRPQAPEAHSGAQH
jgi:single-strand DNA-binding protein